MVKKTFHGNRIVQVVLMILGSLFVAIGFIGVFVPLLPTTPFLLLAIACYIRSSEKMYRKLITSKIFGKYLKNYLEGKGIPLRIKIIALLLLWIAIGFSAFVMMKYWWVSLILILIAIGVSYHITSIRTFRKM